jgi:hypothetical protein
MTRHHCAITGCERTATHEVLEAVLDSASGRAVLRLDKRVPYLCAQHVATDLHEEGFELAFVETWTSGRRHAA